MGFRVGPAERVAVSLIDFGGRAMGGARGKGERRRLLAPPLILRAGQHHLTSHFSDRNIIGSAIDGLERIPAGGRDREVPVMTARPGRTGNGPRARAVVLAVTLSLGLHVLLWWGFGRLRQEGDEPPDGETLCDTRLFLDLSPGRIKPRKGTEEEQGFDVQVAAPSPSPSGSGGTAPVVH